MYLAILAQEAKKSSGSGLLTFIPILAIGGAMYFLLIRPQRKRMKNQQGLLKTIDEGDEIITVEREGAILSVVKDRRRLREEHPERMRVAGPPDVRVHPGAYPEAPPTEEQHSMAR